MACACVHHYCVRVRYRCVYVAGDEVIREQCVTDGLYFLCSGRVAVYKESVGEWPLATLGGGAFFGEMSLLSPHEAKKAVATVKVRHTPTGSHTHSLP